LILVAGLPRLINLGSEHLWFDEAFQWLVSQPKTDLWKAIIGDTHPPLWGLIQAFNLQLFGGSEWTFRLPSAVAGIASILMIYLLALALKLSKRAAFIAGMIAAFMPGLIYFSQDARPYSFLLMSVLICLWGALRGNFFVYLAAAVAAAYTQNTGLIYAGLIGLSMLAVHRKKRGMIFLCGVALLIMYAPWIPILIHQARAVAESYWVAPLNIGSFIKAGFDTSAGTRIPQFFQIPVVAGWGGLTMISLVVSRRWLFRRRALPFWAVFIGSPVALALYSVVVSDVYIYRALLPSGAMIAILWGGAISKLKGEHFKIFSSLTLFVIALSIFSYYTTESRADLNQILAPLREKWQEGDGIYFSNATSAIMFNKYLRLHERDFRIAPLPGSIMNITTDVKTAFGLSTLESAPDKLPFRRIWYVGGLSPFSSEMEWTRYLTIARKASYLHAWGGIHFRNFIILYTP